MSDEWTYEIRFLGGMAWRVQVFRNGRRVDNTLTLTKAGAKRAARRIKRKSLRHPQPRIERGVLR